MFCGCMGDIYQYIKELYNIFITNSGCLLLIVAIGGCSDINGLTSCADISINNMSDVFYYVFFYFCLIRDYDFYT